MADEVRIIRDIIEIGYDTGEFDKSFGDHEVVSLVISAAMQGLDNLWQPLRNGRELTVKDEVDLFMKLILNGLIC